MSITAPTLTTTISASGYVNEIDDNFGNIQSYMDESAAYINSELAGVQTYPFCLYYTGALVDGDMNAGFILPFAGDVVSAYARLETCLTDTDADLVMELRRSGVNIFGTNTLTWDGGDGNTVKTVAASTPLPEVAAGDYLQVYTSFDTHDWTQANGLCLTLLIRRS